MDSVHASSLRTYTERQTRLPGWGAAGQARIAASSVLVVGAGGLGCPALEYLVRAGVGNVTIVDPDTVEISNLGRQSLYTIGDCGQPKAVVATARLSLIHGQTLLQPLVSAVTTKNVRQLVETHDLILDCTDNFAAKFLLHDACHTAKKAFVLASLYQWEAHVQLFSFHLRQQACLHCLYQEIPQDGCVGTCAEVGVSGALAGLAGSAQALAGLRCLLGLDSLAHGTTLIWDSADFTTTNLHWQANPTCSFCSKTANWAWLHTKENTMTASEASWNDLSENDKTHIIDVREASEIGAMDWEKVTRAGGEVLFYPMSQWRDKLPPLVEGRTYVVSCAHGVRSRNAANTWSPLRKGALISLTGGYEAVRRLLTT